MRKLVDINITVHVKDKVYLWLRNTKHMRKLAEVNDTVKDKFSCSSVTPNI